MEQLVLTKKWNKICNRIITEAYILIGKKMLTINVQWDCGANHSSISKELIQELGLKPHKREKVTTIVGEEIKDLYNIEVVLKEDVDISIPVLASEGYNLRKTGIDMLIGMDIIHFGDFAISNYNKKTCFSFRYPSKGFIDFTKE